MRGTHEKQNSENSKKHKRKININNMKKNKHGVTKRTIKGWRSRNSKTNKRNEKLKTQTNRIIKHKARHQAEKTNGKQQNKCEGNIT